MTALDLTTSVNQIRTRLENATPGPWKGEFNEERWEAEIYAAGTDLYIYVQPDPLGNGQCLTPADHALIVHAYEDIQYLLSLVES